MQKIIDLSMLKASTFAIHTSRHADQKLQKSLLSLRKRNNNATQKLNLCNRTNPTKNYFFVDSYAVKRHSQNSVDSASADRTTGYNSTLPKVAVSCFVGQFCGCINFSASLKVCAVNRHLRQAANRCVPCKEIQRTFKHIWFLPTHRQTQKNEKSLNFANARPKRMSNEKTEIKKTNV
jgi:hypothetical protein